MATPDSHVVIYHTFCGYRALDLEHSRRYHVYTCQDYPSYHCILHASYGPCKQTEAITIRPTTGNTTLVMEPREESLRFLNSCYQAWSKPYLKLDPSVPFVEKIMVSLSQTRGRRYSTDRACFRARLFGPTVWPAGSLSTNSCPSCRHDFEEVL
jgi:hypothetical protein